MSFCDFLVDLIMCSHNFSALFIVQCCSRWRTIVEVSTQVPVQWTRRARQGCATVTYMIEHPYVDMACWR